MNEISKRKDVATRRDDLGKTDGPWAPDEVVGAVVEACGSQVTLPPQWLSLVGKNAKEMLEADVPADTVIAACYMAVLRGKPQVAQYIAGDLMLAASGMAMSEREYQTKLALYEADQSQRPNLLEEQRARAAARRAAIDSVRQGDGS